MIDLKKENYFLIIKVVIQDDNKGGRNRREKIVIGCLSLG